MLHLQGHSDADVAEEIGLQRSTIWRWRTQDARYMVALNVERELFYQDTRERMRALAVQATEVIKNALAGGDVKSAWRVLETLGLDKIPPPEEPPTIDDLLRQQAEKEAREEYRETSDVGEIATLLEDFGVDSIANRLLTELREEYELEEG